MEEIETEIENLLTERELDEIYLTLLDAVQENNLFYNNEDLSRIIERSTSATSKRLTKLWKSGFIRKYSDGANNYYRLTQRGENVVRSMGDNFNLDSRSHDLVYIFDIKRAPKDGFDEEGFIVNDNLKNWSQQLSKENTESRVVIQVNGSSSISVLVRQIVAPTPEDAVMFGYIVAEREILDLVEDYPDLVVGNELESCVVPCRISRQSHAITNESFAEYCSKYNIHIPVENSDDRLEADQSHGVPETEFVHPNYAQEDFNRYKQFIEHILEDKISLEALREVSKNRDSLKLLFNLDLNSLKEDYG